MINLLTYADPAELKEIKYNNFNRIERVPELPEVETVAKGLSAHLSFPEEIVSVVTGKKQLRFAYPKGFRQFLNGRKILSLSRRAKYLIFQMDHGVLMSHLGMTGSWRLGGAKQNHDHLTVTLSSGAELIYNDPRRFGYVDILKEENIEDSQWLKHLGPEPLDKNQFHGEYLKRKFARRSGNIKSVIMNQEIVVGVGNIYASEALFLSKISPLKPANKVTLKQCDLLVASIQKVLKKAIRQGGTTIRDFKNASGEGGYFQIQLNVYGKAGEPCVQCKTPIHSQVLSGRNTFWCRKCQK